MCGVEIQFVKMIQMRGTTLENGANTMEKREVKGAAVVEKTMLVLDTVSSRGISSLKDLSRATGLPAATLYRILTVLERHGLVISEGDEKLYQVGYKIVEMAYRRLDAIDIRLLAKDELYELSSRSSETIHLAIRAAYEVVYVDKIDSPNMLRLCSIVGGRAPIYCTSLGKAILSHMSDEAREGIISKLTLHPFTSTTIRDRRALVADLNKARELGYAVNNEEHEVGSRCLGAPIFDHAGRPIAAISLNAPTARVSLGELIAHAPLVMGAARRISANLGYMPAEERGLPEELALATA